MKKLMKKLTFALTLLLSIANSFAQDAKTEEKASKFSAAVDVVYPYLWRGVKYYGDRIAFQPYINYQATEKLTIGVWGSTNFSEAANAYNEFDWSVTYAVNSFTKVTLSDYYWPATLDNAAQIGGSRANYFNYSATAAQTLDLQLVFNFTEKGVPLDFTWSTLVGGADYKNMEFDTNGDYIEGSGKKAFSSYAEIGYTLSPKSLGVDIRPFVGAVINNGGYYPPTGELDDNGNPIIKSFQFTNSGLNVSKVFHLNKGYDFPVFVRYTYNDNGFANPNSVGEPVKNFFSAGMTFKVF
jgi:Bacterial protein of unknown function (Gcw_chp)